MGAAGLGAASGVTGASAIIAGGEAGSGFSATFSFRKSAGDASIFGAIAAERGGRAGVLGAVATTLGAAGVRVSGVGSTLDATAGTGVTTAGAAMLGGDATGAVGNAGAAVLAAPDEMAGATTNGGGAARAIAATATSEGISGCSGTAEGGFDSGAARAGGGRSCSGLSGARAICDGAGAGSPSVGSCRAPLNGLVATSPGAIASGSVPLSRTTVGRQSLLTGAGDCTNLITTVPASGSTFGKVTCTEQ